MKKLLLTCLAAVISMLATAQYKNDNILYTTVDPANLCMYLSATPGYIFLDVRSAGEYHDTLGYAAANIGHIKNAKNIDVRELKKRLQEIADYKNKPVYVYCSHSQRSRRACNILSDSGFTKVYNINGGLSAFYMRSLYYQDTCLKNLITSKAGYRALGGIDLAKKLLMEPDSIVMIDVRSDSAFRYISTDPQSNVIGTLKDAANIPLENLPQQLGNIPKNKTIICIDVYGDRAAKAAEMLYKKGYRKVFFLLEGMQRLLYMPELSFSLRKQSYLPPTTGINIINVIDFSRIRKPDSALIIDARSTEEFENRHADSFRNIGRVKGAINIPYNQPSGIDRLTDRKNLPVYIYEFGSGSNAYQLAFLFKSKGFNNVSVIGGGIFNMRWTVANTNPRTVERLAKLIENIPEYNQ